VRKWLTYIALLIAAGVVVGDLITFLTFFLRGELTARFVAKVTVVLVIAGGVYWYYVGSLQKSALESKKSNE
jgi:threonine/homoserine/homoserine lactone efflux protein